MNSNVPDPQGDAETIGDRNLEHLLERAYHPEVPDADFIARIQAVMQAEAVALANKRDRRLLPLRRLVAWTAAAAAALIGIGLVLHAARPIRQINPAAGNESAELPRPVDASPRTHPVWPDAALTPRP